MLTFHLVSQFGRCQRILVSACILIVWAVAIAPARADGPPEFLWARQSIGGSVEPRGLAVDQGGNCYFSGYFYGDSELNGIRLTNSGVLLAKYDHAGKPLWTKQEPMDFWGSYAVGSLAVDCASNVYLLSAFGNPTTSIDGITLTNLGGSTTVSVFVAKFDLKGDLQWAKLAGWGWGLQAIDLVADADQNCYWTGLFQGGRATFGTNTLSGGRLGLVVAKHDHQGNLIWLRGATGDVAGSGIATDSSANVYVSGTFWDAMDLGVTNLISFGSADIFLAKYAPGGELLWVRQAGGADNDGNNQGLGVDPAGNSFLHGGFRGVAQIGGRTLGQSLTTSVFTAVAKYNPQGDPVWSRELSAGDDSFPPRLHGLTTDVNGNIYALDGFGERVSSYDNAGNVNWTRAVPNVDLKRVKVDAAGNCYFAGRFEVPSIELGQITLTNASAAAGFVAKLETTTPPPLSIAISSNSVTLAWSALAENFHVESASELGPATIWTSNGVAASTVRLSNLVTLPWSGDKNFYRLKRP